MPSPFTRNLHQVRDYRLYVVYIVYRLQNICTIVQKPVRPSKSGSAVPVEMGPSLALLGHWPRILQCPPILYNRLGSEITSNHLAIQVMLGIKWFPRHRIFISFLYAWMACSRRPPCIIASSRRNTITSVTFGDWIHRKNSYSCQRPALGTFPRPSYTNHRSV